MTELLRVDEEFGQAWDPSDLMSDAELRERELEEARAVAAFRERWERAVEEHKHKRRRRLPLKYSEDQERDERGRFAGGGGVGISEEEASGLASAAAGGGFSEQPFTGTEPTTGFMVAGISEPVEVHVANEAEAAGAIMGYVDSHAEDFARDPNLFIGGWLDSDGMLVIELAENVSDRAEAAARGEERNQVAIWDVERTTEIPTGGTGEFRGSEADRQDIRAASRELGGDDRRAEAGVEPGARSEAEGRVREQGVSPALLKFWDPDAPAELKYSEDQPRDERGRFGSGGGEETAPAGEQQTLLGGDNPQGLNAAELGTARLEDLFAQARGGGPEDAKMGNIERLQGALTERAETDRQLGRNMSDLAMTQFQGLDEYFAPAHFGRAGVSEDLQDRAKAEMEAFERGSMERMPALEEVGARLFAMNTQDSWAGSSTDSSLTSLALQEAVRERFGQGDLKWLDPYMSRPAETWDVQQAQMGAGITPSGSTFGDYVNFVGASAPMTAYMEAVYSSTQEQLKAAGIGEVTLYRGVHPGPMSDALKSGEDVTLSPLSSFSLSGETAQGGFAGGGGATIEVTVPAERIFSIPMTGVGCLGEDECVVLGGPIDYEVVDPQGREQAYAGVQAYEAEAAAEAQYAAAKES